MTKTRIAVLDEDPFAREELQHLLQVKTEVELFSTESDFQRSGDIAEYDALLVESAVARRLHLWMMQAGFPTPVIYMSSQPTISDAITAIKLGAVDYLNKPVVAEELFNALDAAVRQKRSGVPDRFFKTHDALDSMVNGMERELICAALQRSHGVVGGNHGAAAMLGVTRTGLLYKMKRLGVSRALVAASEAVGEDEPPAHSSPVGVSSSTTS